MIDRGLGSAGSGQGTRKDRVEWSTTRSSTESVALSYRLRGSRNCGVEIQRLDPQAASRPHKGDNLLSEGEVLDDELSLRPAEYPQGSDTEGHEEDE